jgi:hypothetical protein
MTVDHLMQVHCRLGPHRLEEDLLITVFHNCQALNFQKDLEYFLLFF